MTDEKKPVEKEEKDKTPKLEDLTPEKDPSGGKTEHKYPRR
jgi:hypothetical protein